LPSVIWLIAEEEQHTFRTTPQEHWWIWPECPRHAQVNN